VIGRLEQSVRQSWRQVGLIILAMGLLLGCGVEPKPYSGVCRDPQSNACVPCPGVDNICVDPVICVAVQCGADALFGPKDADTGSGDGSAADGDSQDATFQDVKDASSDLDAGPEIDASAGTDAVADVGKDTPADSPDTPEVLLDTLADSADVAGCKEPCPALNLVECLPGVAATRTCQWTVAGCLNWATPMACSPGLVCSNGLCQPSSPCPGGCPNGSSCQGGVCVPSGGGSLSCAQITACIGNCAASDAACPDSCKAKGSASGVQLLSAYQGCLKAVCKSLADQGKFNETMLCIFNNCYSEQAACIGSGNADCKTYADCLAQCGSSATCTSGCNNQVSEQGGKEYYGLMSCVDNQCGGLSGQDQLSCAQSSCKQSWDKCFGSGVYLYTTCLQVAQCQGKCGGDSGCAKACKTAASPLAQAAVDAFITCRENKCGTFCVNTASPNCSACITQYCATELATCSI
jgi:hypothetical protein